MVNMVHIVYTKPNLVLIIESITKNVFTFIAHFIWWEAVDEHIF